MQMRVRGERFTSHSLFILLFQSPSIRRKCDHAHCGMESFRKYKKVIFVMSDQVTAKKKKSFCETVVTSFFVPRNSRSVLYVTADQLLNYHYR